MFKIMSNMGKCETETASKEAAIAYLKVLEETELQMRQWRKLSSEMNAVYFTPGQEKIEPHYYEITYWIEEVK